MQKDTDSLLLRPIAYARNGFTDKFGIPRQSRPESVIETHIVFEPSYRHEEALRGIEEYSHLWLIWGFSANNEAASPNHLTVRPPRLGGNRRVGVFATRSPFRPNPLGLTSVRLLRVENGELIVSGADLLNSTPIYDIKPYLPYSDAHPQASNGLAANTHDYHLQVVGLEGIEPLSDRAALQEILQQDPRPAYQHDPERIYGLDYSGWNVQFKVQENTLYVIKTSKLA